MSKVIVNKNLDPIRIPEKGLEGKLIAEYLNNQGYQISDLKHLPEEDRKDLMKAACLYAAIRLANIEARSKFIQKIELPR